MHAYLGQTLLETNAFQLATVLEAQLEHGLRLRGGNNRLIETLLNRTGVQLKMSTQISQITTAANGSVTVKSFSTLPGSNGEVTHMAFDSVVVAAPWTSTSIEMPDLDFPPASIGYTGLFVTHFLSFFDSDQDRLDLDPKDPLPEDILFSPPSTKGARPNTKDPATVRLFRITKQDQSPAFAHTKDSPCPNLYRVMSSRTPVDSDLLKLLHKPAQLQNAELGNENVEGPIIWRHTEHWPFAYLTADYEMSPYFTQLADNIFTAAPGELLGSRMEIAVTMGANAARLVHESASNFSLFQGDLNE